MGQLGIAAQRDATTGAMPNSFAPVRQVADSPIQKCADETVFLAEITWKDRTFVFNRPLPVRVSQEDGGWTLESKEYRLMAYGIQRTQAESDFCFMFAECWDEIACESDEKLTQGAIDQKRALLGLVKAQG